MSQHLRKRLVLVALAAIFAVCGAASLRSQETRATVRGEIQDPNGAAIPSAKVTATNTGTGVATVVNTSADGTYTIPFLIPGTYVISADASGFKTAQQTNLILHVGDKVEVNLSLPLGQVTEVVTVSDTPPLLETGSATRGELIDSQRVAMLPLAGRNPFMLAQLVTGVQFQGNPAFQRPFDNGDNANFTINGGLRQSNAYLIDGAPDDAVSDTAGDRSHANLNVAYIPQIDATQEFKIVSNFYDAQYGRTGGGVFNVSTKAGTNVFHGDAYYFMRRYQLDANSISNKAAGFPRYSLDPVTKANLGGHTLNDYGGSGGGPVWLPHLYNGKDRLFFYAALEHYHEVQPTPTLTGVPTLAERTGDFSAAGEPAIYDPWSTRLDANGNCCIRDQFQGNKIPSSRIPNTSPGYLLLNAFPKPNVGSGLLVNNYSTGTNTSEDHFNNYLLRVDDNISEKERMYFRYAHGRRNQFDHGSYNFTGPLFDAQDPLARSNDSAVIDSVTVFTSHIIMDLRASLARYTEVVNRGTVSGFDDTKLGLSSTFNGQRFVPVPPRISLGNQNANNIPDAGTRNPRFGISTLMAFQPSLQMLYGRHAIHFGADVRNMAYATGGGSFVYGGGAFAFNASFTQANPNATYNGTSGSSTASLLLGAPAASNNSINSIIQYTPRLLYRWWYTGYYLQDDYKITRRLTVNLGLRYDIEGSPAESQNRMNRGFDTVDASPLAGVAKTVSGSVCPACQNLVGGLYFAGVNGQSASAFNTEHGHVQPRAGAAFQLFQKTVIRGGYGRFFLPEAAFGAAQGFAQDTAYVPNNTSSGTVGLNTPRGADPTNPPLINPFPTVLQPPGSSAGLSTFLGQSIIFNNTKRKIPVADQWSAGVQQELPGSFKVDLSYVGMHTEHINTNDNQAGGARNINVLSAKQIASIQQLVAASPTGNSGQYESASQYVGDAVANPFAGQIPGSNLNGASTSRQQLLLPYPQFQGINYGQESVGKLWYNAAQLTAEKQYQNGFSFLVSYVWSKTEEQLSFLNPQDAAPHKNIGVTDRPQHLVISGLYELPFGHGHRLLSDANRPVELLAGGWQLNLIETIQSGLPIGLPGNANLIGNPKPATKNRQSWFNPCVQKAPTFNSATGKYTPGAIVSQGVTSTCTPVWQVINSSNLDFRQSGFYDGRLRVPTEPQMDLSLVKALKFSERYKGEFRVEAFNATNTWIEGGPNTNPTSAAFATIGMAQSNIDRQVQFGFKFNF